MLGSSVMWIWVLRVLLSLRERPGTTADLPGPSEAAAVPTRA